MHDNLNTKNPKVNVDILVKKGNKILLGLLNKQWWSKNKPVYGAPGRDVYFGETIGQAVKRNIKEEIGCQVIYYKIICVNANYELGNHYIGIGIVAEIEGKVKLLKPQDWQKWKWFDVQKLPKHLFPAAKNLIECYLKNKVCLSE